MKEVRKKSNDEAIRRLLIKAFRQHTDLAWDRLEGQQPQCGFGKQLICCSDCADGPCRINPFAADEQRAVCGRGRSEMVGRVLLARTADGAMSLAKLATEFGAEVKPALWAAIAAPADNMTAPADITARMAALGAAVNELQAAVAAARDKALGAGPLAIEANMGVLMADAVNVMVHGHVPPVVLAQLDQQSGLAGAPVNIVAVCGSEAAGAVNFPILTNYQSQEVALLTGAVDMIVFGGQCVMPAVLRLAAEMGIQAVEASTLSDGAKAKAALESAVQAFRKRAGRSLDIPAEKVALQSGYRAAGVKAILKQKAKGFVYIGGCGSTGGTQDAAAVKAAGALIEAGYLVFTAGCAGVSLAKAGLCSAVGPNEAPRAIHLGTCTDVAAFLEIARSAKSDKVPVAAVMLELTHDKTLATAVGFAAAGISVFIDSGAMLEDETVAMAVGTAMKAKTGGQLAPVPEIADLAGAVAKLFSDLR